MSKFMEDFALRTQEAPSYRHVLNNPDNFTSDDVRQATLVLSDLYYGPLYETALTATGSHADAVAQIAAAGCFDDRLDTRPDEDHWFLSGPYNLLAKNFIPEQRNIVLVGTGSYDPMHNGHVAMMTLTREALEETPGINVVGAVMSSSHDSYVRRYKTPDGPPQAERIQRNQMFLENHPDNQQPWIIHDCWETMAVPVAVNFTDVLNHIQAMVDRHVGNGVELVYIFGSDAQGFAMTFTHGNPKLATGACVVRPGYPVSDETSNLTGVRIIEGGLDESSTRIRAATRKPFLIRADGKRASGYLAEVIPQYEDRLDRFQSEVRAAFSSVHDPLLTIDVDQQIQSTRKHLANNYPGYEVITSDIYFTEGSPVRASRLFHPASSQHHGHSTTPIASLAQRMDRPYVFVDDDICSGFFLAQMRQHYRVDRSVSMAKLVVPGEHLDVVDERDFLIGARHGGLMMDLEGGVRFPYLAPFVNLGTRATVPGDRVVDINLTLWNANRNFYAGTGMNPGDLENTRFLTILGIDHLTVEQICGLFIERLSS